MQEKQIGVITHFFEKINVGTIKLDDTLKVGDKIKIQGATTNLEQEISEMQLNHTSINEAQMGQEIGLKVTGKVREGDKVFLL